MVKSKISKKLPMEQARMALRRRAGSCSGLMPAGPSVVALAIAASTSSGWAQQAANPLIQNGQKLIPSVTRVFSAARDMYVYLQAYQPAAETAQPLVAFVTFYRGQTKAFESSPIAVKETVDSRLKTTPVGFTLSLNKLTPGEYNCQVTVLDPTGKKAAFWQAPVMLVR